MNGYYKLLIEIIKRHGGFFVRSGRGDHEIWKCGDFQTVVDRGIKSRVTANACLKQLHINERL